MAYISKDSYRSWVLQFSASLALNLIISRHLLLQVKLSISSSVEGKKTNKKIPNWKIIQKQSRKIWGLSWKIWAHADCSRTHSKLLARHRRLLTTRSLPFQRKEKTQFCTTELFLYHYPTPPTNTECVNWRCTATGPYVKNFYYQTLVWYRTLYILRSNWIGYTSI